MGYDDLYSSVEEFAAKVHPARTVELHCEFLVQDFLSMGAGLVVDIPAVISEEMSLLETVLLQIERSSNILRPITIQLPLSSVPHLSAFLTHVTTNPVHPTYFPYLIFGAIHAARVTTVWASLIRGKNASGARAGRLQDLAGYLTMACGLFTVVRLVGMPTRLSGGGGTVTSLLLSQPPSWLMSPTPWILYTTIYVLLIPTKLSHYIVTACPPLPFNIVTAYIDGLTRGTTIASLPSTIRSSGVTSNWFTDIILSGIAISAGGWLVSGFGLHEAEWKIAVPPALHGGVLATLDICGGMSVALVYGALLRNHEEYAPVTDFFVRILPEDVKTYEKGIGGTTPLVTPDTGRAICVLILGTLLAARVVTTYALGWRVAAKKGLAVKGKKNEEVKRSATLSASDEAEVVKSHTKSEKQAATPRRSPRARSVQ